MDDDCVEHFSHRHTLRFRMVSDEETDIICRFCNYQICGPAYTCKDCSFWLYKSCSELPELHEVIEKHPFHSSHRLLRYRVGVLLKDVIFICDGCGQLCSKNRFVCNRCNFSLDIKCALITDKEVEAGTRCRDVKNTKHFSHEHHLTYCIARKQFELKCLGCKEVISGPAYACLSCDFFLHETCLNDIPEEITEHPFHADPLLPIPSSDDIAPCDACAENIRSIGFMCGGCDFNLHVSCAKYKTRAIKHKLHRHDLLYFGPRNIGRHAACDSCGEDCNSSFFCCMKCNLNIHLECLRLPLTVKHSRHAHLLKLENSIKDDCEQYFCDICETKRDPEHHVYYCKDCNFSIHIDYVISKVN